MPVTEFRDYRDYLRTVLESRVSKNSRYSLRAFARDLKISPQMLSFVLNGKKGLSAKASAEIADRLEMPPEEADYFSDLVSFAHARSASARKLAKRRIDDRSGSAQPYRRLDAEVFKMIADWHHYAILELTFVKGFKDDPKWVARRLGISAIEASQALGRLKALSLLVTDERGALKKADSHVFASYGVPSAALRKLARQVLQKGIESIESQSIEERDFTNITMAVDPALLPEAKKMIAQFRRKLCAFLEQGSRTEVYVFAPSLFRMTQR
jgi:uncharacterized protein (TIGR02147 family)